MPPDTRVRPDAGSGDGLAGGHRGRRTARAIAAYLLLAIALLGVSEMLWLWHSWPVRHVLDSEQLIAGDVL